jgi:peptidoglycan/xylan/chitin deacetylase (PgdA/CDA1 family)
MIGFLQKIIRPPLIKIGLYDRAYRVFFDLCNFYFQSTNKIKKRVQKTALILTYHRVDKVANDPHLLCVSPDNFENHLRFLKENYEVIPLPELLLRLRNKGLTGQEAVVTFDDGYRDNYTNALPLLEKYNCPATIFVTTGFLGQQASQSWDFEYSINDRAWFLNPDEIRRLSESPLITIGAHTHTHPRLSKITNSKQLLELQDSKSLLEALTGKEIFLFAYPFGGIFDFTNDTKKLVSGAGFSVACTTTPMLVTYSHNLLSLPRINMRDYSNPDFSKNIYAS